MFFGGLFGGVLGSCGNTRNSAEKLRCFQILELTRGVKSEKCFRDTFFRRCRPFFDLNITPGTLCGVGATQNLGQTYRGKRGICGTEIGTLSGARRRRGYCRAPFQCRPCRGARRRRAVAEGFSPKLPRAHWIGPGM